MSQSSPCGSDIHTLKEELVLLGRGTSWEHQEEEKSDMNQGSQSVTQDKRWVSEQRLVVRIPGKEKPHLERVGKRELRLGDEAGSPPGIKDTGNHGGAVRRLVWLSLTAKQSP